MTERATDRRADVFADREDAARAAAGPPQQRAEPRNLGEPVLDAVRQHREGDPCRRDLTRGEPDLRKRVPEQDHVGSTVPDLVVEGRAELGGRPQARAPDPPDGERELRVEGGVTVIRRREHADPIGGQVIGEIEDEPLDAALARREVVRDDQRGRKVAG